MVVYVVVYIVYYVVYVVYVVLFSTRVALSFLLQLFVNIPFHHKMTFLKRGYVLHFFF